MNHQRHYLVVVSEAVFCYKNYGKQDVAPLQYINAFNTSQ